MNSSHIDTYLPVANPNEQHTHLEISVYYRKAGMSFATYKHVRGGIYVSCMPVKKERGSVEFAAFTSKSILVEDASRLNRKKVEAWSGEARRQIEAKEGEVWELVAHICAEHGLTLAESQTPNTNAVETREPVLA